MQSQVMSKEQAEKTIEKLTKQKRQLERVGRPHLVKQNQKIINRLNRRIKIGKYKGE